MMEEPTFNPKVFLVPPANKILIPPSIQRPISMVVKVSGMPEMLSEEKIKELFDHCGQINEVWKNDSNMCFIEFKTETASSNALLMTGSTVVVVGGLRLSSVLVVNYALDCEVKRPVIPFTKEAYDMVSSKLSNASTLSEGTEILTRWLQNGECTHENANDFFSLLQITSASADKMDKLANKVNKAESKLNAAVSDIADYLSILDQVFNHENFDSILDNFPEKERENLVQWKKGFEEAKVEVNRDQNKKGKNKKNRRSKKKAANNENVTREELLKLKQEKEDLELQLDVANLALANERIEQQQEIDALKLSVLEAQKQCAEYEAQLAEWRIIHAKLRKAEADELVECIEHDNFSSTEAKILTEISTYLGERLGATLGDIRTHLKRKDFQCTAKSIVQLMRRFPALFREESVGSGPTMKFKWVFIGSRI